MSDELDWNFASKDDAKGEIRAAVEYLLNAADSDRGDIVREIIDIVGKVATAPDLPNFQLPIPRRGETDRMRLPELGVLYRRGRAGEYQFNIRGSASMSSGDMVIRSALTAI
jgi:hypothetical protein